MTTTTIDSNVHENNVEMSVSLDQSLDPNKLLNEHISQMQPFYLMRSTPRNILFESLFFLVRISALVRIEIC